MSMAQPLYAANLPPSGGCEFLTRAQRSERCRHLAEHGWVVARVVPVFDRCELDQHESECDDDEPTSGPGTRGPVYRGGLREALEGAVEISLALRGALPPEVSAIAPALPTARDQLFRVRTLGATGLCLVLPELRGLSERGVLEADDSAALSVWRTLCEDEPLWLLFDEGDADVAMLAPQRLTESFARYAEPHTDHAPPSWADDLRDDVDVPFDTLSDELADPPMEEPATIPGWHRPEEEPSMEALQQEAQQQELPIAVEAVVEKPPIEKPAESGQRVMPHDPLEGLDDIDEAAPFEAMPMQPSLFDSIPDRPRLSPAKCAELAAELMEARGPKPVRIIEELFRTRYTPLSEMVGRGFDDEAAQEALESWRASFEKSYTDGFTTMRLTGKRPTMVLDAPDIAARIGRLNGARAVQLLLVDGMRYDLGQRVRAELIERLGDRAACIEEALMWAALPTVTPQQLRLLARGPRALREGEPPSETSDPVVHRDGSVTALRRVRIGQRDLLKLDVVEARLRDPGPAFDTRLDGIACEVGEVIARHAEALPPRTLLFVFGDHGFVLPVENARTTGPASQGGASPEEVLVGAQAWLIGGLH